MTRTLPVLLFCVLAACTGEPAARYLLERPETGEPVRISVATVELRDVVLPGHASASEVLFQTTSGAVVPLGAAVWADDPVRAVTSTLAEAMDLGTTATVAAEPWPLFERAEAQVEVRFTRMLARADGVFEMAGQAAVSSSDPRVRERVERFEIATPLTDATPASVAEAAGRGLATLAQQLVDLLR